MGGGGGVKKETLTPYFPLYQESSPKGIWAPFFTPPPPPISPHLSYAYYFDHNKSWPLVSSAYYFDHRQYEGHFVYTNGTLGRDAARSFDRSFYFVFQFLLISVNWPVHEQSGAIGSA